MRVWELRAGDVDDFAMIVPAIEASRHALARSGYGSWNRLDSRSTVGRDRRNPLSCANGCDASKAFLSRSSRASRWRLSLCWHSASCSRRFSLASRSCRCVGCSAVSSRQVATIPSGDPDRHEASNVGEVLTLPQDVLRCLRTL